MLLVLSSPRCSSLCFCKVLKSYLLGTFLRLFSSTFIKCFQGLKQESQKSSVLKVFRGVCESSIRGDILGLAITLPLLGTKGFSAALFQKV